MITAIIPARGGSKRLPGKNLARIGGSTLVELAIRCAQEVDEIDIIAVSTDCPDIAAEAFRCRALVIPRPAELATDDATSEEVAKHVANELLLGEDEQIMLLQPTSPLRTPDDLRGVIRHANKGYVSVFTTTDGRPNGLAYVCWMSWILEGNRFCEGVTHETPDDRAVDIDTAEDLARAQEWWCRRAVA